jgi:hypothetical protein
MAATSAVKRLQAVIAPSMLASDFASLAAEAENIVRNGADWLHMDVMVSFFPCSDKDSNGVEIGLHNGLALCPCLRAAV